MFFFFFVSQEAILALKIKVDFGFIIGTQEIRSSGLEYWLRI